MHFFSVLQASALIAAAAAAPGSAVHVLHERRPESLMWEKRERLHPDVKLPVRIGLTQQNLEFGERWLMEVSDPTSTKYGKHYTVDEVTDLFAPSEESVASVKAWLESVGVGADRVSQSVNKQWLQFDAKTAELEDMLLAKYHVFKHGPSGSDSIACDEYHLPEHIQQHVDYITPGIKLSAMKVGQRKEKRTTMIQASKGKNSQPPLTESVPVSMAQVNDDDLSRCGTMITPACIRAMYNLTKATSAVAGNELGIFEGEGDVYSQKDLNLFFQQLQPRIPQGTHPILDLIDGAVAPVPVKHAGLESALDFQISYPIIWPQNSVLYQTNNVNTTLKGEFNNFFDAIDGSYCTYSAFGETGNSPLDPVYPDPAKNGYKGQLQCGKYRPTNVISISYGTGEADLPINYQRRQCNEIMKLGMQGISVVVATGDFGVANIPPLNDPGPNGCLGKKGHIFAPGFPDTCPWIINIGSTVLPRGADVNKDEEVATTRFGSAGGFSNIYPQPEYQKKAVQSYLTNYPPPYKSYASHLNDSFGADGGIYNRIGRAYPDFAAIGDHIMIYAKGKPRLASGTSASAPVFASILTRINNERLAAGKSTVGFVNPTLYANPQVLHDITVGNNPGCGTKGFSAAPGWDPVTGFGTPNYPAMLKLFMSLP